MMTVFLATSLLNGVETVSLYRIIQLFAIAAIGGALMLVAFSSIFIKKISFILRMVIFIIPFSVITLIFAGAFSWFEVDNLLSLAVFVLIFLGCFVLSICIYFIECKIRGKKYTEKLILMDFVQRLTATVQTMFARV